MNWRNFAMPSADSKIEVHARVHAGVAEVSVERAFVVERGHHVAQVAKIATELVGSDRSVFPSFPGQRLAGHVRSHAKTRFANLPNAFGLLAGEEAHVRRIRAVFECVALDRELAIRLLVRVWPPNSTMSQPPPSGSMRESFGVHALGAVVVDEEVVEAFEADGFVLQDFRDVVGALIDVGIADD